jgi:hypothetical protein
MRFKIPIRLKLSPNTSKFYNRTMLLLLLLLLLLYVLRCYRAQAFLVEENQTQEHPLLQPQPQPRLQNKDCDCDHRVMSIIAILAQVLQLYSMNE